MVTEAPDFGDVDGLVAPIDGQWTGIAELSVDRRFSVGGSSAVRFAGEYCQLRVAIDLVFPNAMSSSVGDENDAVERGDSGRLAAMMVTRKVFVDENEGSRVAGHFFDGPRGTLRASPHACLTKEVLLLGI